MKRRAFLQTAAGLAFFAAPRALRAQSRTDAGTDGPPFPPWRTTTIETPFVHSVHAYHGVCPWNRKGTHLVYLGFDDPEAEAQVVVRELKSGQDTTLARTRLFDFHTAAWQRWVLGDRAILFLTEGADGRRYPAVVPVGAPGKVRLLKSLPDRTIRHVCADGVHALAYWSSADSQAAIERVHLETEQAETLVRVADVLAALPRELHDPAAGYFMNHPVSNAQETRLFFKLMKTSPDGAREFCAFFVMDLATRQPRSFGRTISGHPFWMADGRGILNIKGTGERNGNRWLVSVDAETGEDHRLVDRPIEGPGHPSQSPDGRRLATDAFTRDGLQSPIYVADLASGSLREIARLSHHFQGGRPYRPQEITRGQPHPVWSPCGKRLLVNCNHGGQRMRLVVLES